MRDLKPAAWALAVISSMMFFAGCGDDSGSGGNNQNDNVNDNSNVNQNEAVCGNNLVEGDEVCDGSDLGGQECSEQGFGGGELACASDCSRLVTEGCCVDGCEQQGDTECDGDTLQTCEERASGCLDWTLLDCTDAGQVCHDTGSEAFCAGECTSDCDTEGEHRCSGDVVEVCVVNGICLNWAEESDCGANVGCDGGSCRPDLDGDGYSETLGDCDDGDADVHPDAPEIPGDGIDQNCDGPDGRVGIDQYVQGGFAVSALAFAVESCVSDATDNCYVMSSGARSSSPSPLRSKTTMGRPMRSASSAAMTPTGSF
jgi:hypothetical protein